MPSPSGSLARTVATRVLGPASSDTNVRYLRSGTQALQVQESESTHMEVKIIDGNTQTGGTSHSHSPQHQRAYY